MLALLTLDLVAAGFHFGGGHRAGDALFTLCLGVFLFVAGRRFIVRKDPPSSNFVLVTSGLLSGLAGTILLSLFENEAYATEYRIGTSLLEQGFVLLPILGVAPFLLPRLLDLPRGNDLPESRTLPPGWIGQAIFSATIGIIVNLTLSLDRLVKVASVAGCD